jgi:hypothetical protein
LLSIASSSSSEVLSLASLYCHCCPAVAAAVAAVQGKHTLALQFANALHESYGPQWNSSITVDVK